MPYEVPVAKDIMDPIINIIAGKINFGKAFDNTATKNFAVPSSFITPLSDQANNNITQVIIRDFIPSIQASIASPNLNIFLCTPMPIATMLATNAAWNKTMLASELLKVSLIAAKDAGLFVIIAFKAASFPAIILSYPLK